MPELAQQLIYDIYNDHVKDVIATVQSNFNAGPDEPSQEQLDYYVSKWEVPGPLSTSTKHKIEVRWGGLNGTYPTGNPNAITHIPIGPHAQNVIDKHIYQIFSGYNAPEIFFAVKLGPCCAHFQLLSPTTLKGRSVSAPLGEDEWEQLNPCGVDASLLDLLGEIDLFKSAGSESPPTLTVEEGIYTFIYNKVSFLQGYRYELDSVKYDLEGFITWTSYWFSEIMNFSLGGSARYTASGSAATALAAASYTPLRAIFVKQYVNMEMNLGVSVYDATTTSNGNPLPLGYSLRTSPIRYCPSEGSIAEPEFFYDYSDVTSSGGIKRTRQQIYGWSPTLCCNDLNTAFSSTLADDIYDLWAQFKIIIGHYISAVSYPWSASLTEFRIGNLFWRHKPTS